MTKEEIAQFDTVKGSLEKLNQHLQDYTKQYSWMAEKIVILEKFQRRLLGAEGWMQWVEGKVSTLPTINLVNCKKCGRELRGGETTCGICGKKVTE